MIITKIMWKLMQVESVIEFNQVLLKYAKLNQYEGNHYTYYTSCYFF